MKLLILAKQESGPHNCAKLFVSIVQRDPIKSLVVAQALQLVARRHFVLDVRFDLRYSRFARSAFRTKLLNQQIVDANVEFALVFQNQIPGVLWRKPCATRKEKRQEALELKHVDRNVGSRRRSSPRARPYEKVAEIVREHRKSELGKRAAFQRRQKLVPGWKSAAFWWTVELQIRAVEQDCSISVGIKTRGRVSTSGAAQEVVQEPSKVLVVHFKRLVLIHCCFVKCDKLGPRSFLVLESANMNGLDQHQYFFVYATVFVLGICVLLFSLTSCCEKVGDWRQRKMLIQ